MKNPQATNPKCVWIFYIFILFLAGCFVSQIARADGAFTVLGEFPLTSNTAPWHPDNALVQSVTGDFYGTTFTGGTNSNGTVFKMTQAGTLSRVFAFNGYNGMFPRGVTFGDDGNLYGVAAQTGFSFYGSIFEMTTSGNFIAHQTNGPFASFFFFGGTDGSGPNGPLVLGKNGVFYGTTSSGGSGNGTVFAISTNGQFANLWMFNGTNGSQPESGLTWGSDGNLYGTTEYGGTNYTGAGTGDGTMFRITTNGLLTTLAYFNGANGSAPFAGLTLGNNGNFYGTTTEGGVYNFGTIFQITTNNVLTTLVSFNATNGCNPFGGLVQGNDGEFYGTTAFSSTNYLTLSYGYGTVFRVTPSGALTTLLFLNGTNGLHPYPDMIQGGDGSLYGTMNDVDGYPLLDGSSGNVFRLIPQPLIGIGRKNNGALLSWNSVSNGVYWVEYKSSLNDPAWTPLFTNTAGSFVSSYTNGSLGTTQRFYRVIMP